MYKLCYGLIRKKWFSKLQAKGLCVPENLFEQYYSDSLKLSKQTLIQLTLSNGNYAIKPSLAHCKTKTLILVGGKELKIMKQSAQLLHEILPQSELNIIENHKHGELSLVHPDHYVKVFKQFLKGDINT